jgi:threonine synthase
VNDELTCSTCDWTAAASPEIWRCPSCGSVIELAAEGELDVDALHGEGFARYSQWLGIESLASLGEARAPLVELASAPGARIKNEGLHPTGSFKDRGAAALITWLARQGVGRVVVDSSGNAGAAIAAYAARTGIECEVHVPARTSVTKVRQAEAYGARVVRHDGPRSASTDAAQRAAEHSGVVYASQLWHPAFVRGVETIAFELWEQCGDAPEVIVMPVGAGSLLLGVARGFQRLRQAGLTARTPRLVGVQSVTCTPIASRFASANGPEPGVQSIAEGIQVQAPPRADQVVAAIDASGGTCLVVADAEIAVKMRAAGWEGLLVEPTAAGALAGLDAARNRGLIAGDGRVVVIVTGSGIKTLGSLPAQAIDKERVHDI